MNASKQIDKEIASLTDWRGRMMADIRRIIHSAVPEIIEEWKWMGTPVWCLNGNICAADAHKSVVKVIFFKGASLSDPDKLFNAELEGSTRRAMKFVDGDTINERAFMKLVQSGAELNSAKSGIKKSKNRSVAKSNQAA